MKKILLAQIVVLFFSCSTKQNAKAENDPFSIFKTPIKPTTINILDKDNREYVALKGNKLKNYTVITNDKNNLVLNISGIKLDSKNIDDNNYKYLKNIKTQTSEIGSTINIGLKDNPGFKVYKRNSGLLLAIGPGYIQIADAELDDLENQLFGDSDSENLDSIEPVVSNEPVEEIAKEVKITAEPKEDYGASVLDTFEEKQTIAEPEEVVAPPQKIATPEKVIETPITPEYETETFVQQDEAVETPVQTQEEDTSARVKNIDFVKLIDKLRLTITTSFAINYEKQEDAVNNQVKLILENTRLPKSLSRPYDTSEFNGSVVSMIIPKNGTGPYKNTEIIMQFRNDIDYTVNQEEDTINVDFPIVSTEDYNADLDITDSTNKDIDEFSDNGVNDLEAARQMSRFNFEDYLAEPKKFYGTKMSIEVVEADIIDVLILIQEVSGINISASNDVKGIKVSASLKNVPWDQVLSVVLQNAGLAYLRQGSVISVAKLETLRNDRVLAAQTLEAHRKLETSKIFVRKLNYSSVSSIEKKLKPLLSEKGQMSIDADTNSVIVSDVQDSVLKIDRLLNIIDKKPYQIAIEANIVEANHAWISSMGFDFISGSGSDFAFKNVSGYGDIKSFLGIGSSSNNLKIISAPKVTTLDNRMASIVQGTQVAYQSIDEKSQERIGKIEFKDVQVVLAVTPKVTSNNEILLDIDVKREFPDYRFRQNKQLPPGVGVRRATTQILMKNGDTAVIGGLYSLDKGDGAYGTPGIRLIPIVGWLFGKSEDRDIKNELMIFINARIIDIDKTGVAAN